MLTDCLPYFLVSWGGLSRQSKLDHLVLCACESVERVKQFLKCVGKVWLNYFLIKIQLSSAILSGIWVCFNPWKEGLYVHYDPKSTLAVKIYFAKFKVFEWN